MVGGLHRAAGGRPFKVANPFQGLGKRNRIVRKSVVRGIQGQPFPDPGSAADPGTGRSGAAEEDGCQGYRDHRKRYR